MIALCADTVTRSSPVGAEAEEGGDGDKWNDLGKGGFKGENGGEVRRAVVEGVLSGGGTGGWCDEQVSRLIDVP